MKIIIIGLISVVSFVSGSPAYADLLGKGDDTYIGFQVSVPLAAKRGKLMPGRFEYSALLINQQDGMRDGIVFTRDSSGNRTLGYVAPSRTYEIARSRASDYTIPVVSVNEGEIRSAFDAMDLAVGFVVVVAVIGKAADKIISETTDCIDPDVDSKEIAGC